MDHRWGRRIRVDIPVRVAAHRFAVRDGRLIDLSVSGALIEAELDAPVLTRVQVALILPTRPRPEAEFLDAYVARRHRHGIAVEWCEFAPRTVRELLREIPNGSYALSLWSGFEVRNQPGA